MFCVWLAVWISRAYGGIHAHYHELLKLLPLERVISLDSYVGMLRATYIAAASGGVVLGFLGALRRPRWPGISAATIALIIAIDLALTMW